MENRFNYFYDNENENYLFLQMPKILIKDKKFRELSDSAKILYSLLLERTSLSRKNGWKDSEKRVYIIYTITEIMEDLNCWEQKAVKSMAELKKIGLIRTVRRMNKPSLIYVMNFADTDLKYKIKEKEKDEKTSILPLSCENHSTEIVKITVPELRKSQSNNTNRNNTNFSKTDISIYPAQGESEAIENKPTEPETIDMIDTTKKEKISEAVADKICLYNLINEYPNKKDKIMELYQSICDVLAGDKTDTIRIAKKQVPIAMVKQVFASLEKAHIMYVLNCLEKNGSNINGNAKGYIITSLFNSIHTIGYYKPQNQSAFAFADNSNPPPKMKYDDKFFENLVKKSLKF